MLIDAPPLDPSAADRAVAALRSGGVVIFPTETFYGLAADACNERAVAQVALLKGRSMGKAIACIIGAGAGAPSQREVLCSQWSEEAERLARRFWPGPLTLVLPARAGLPAALSPEGWVGLRRSSHPWAEQLAQLFGGPLTATSANLAGEAEATRIEEIAPALLGGAGVVLDAGRLPGGRGSTVVKLGAEGPVCLRQGAIPFETVLACLAQPP